MSGVITGDLNMTVLGEPQALTEIKQSRTEPTRPTLTEEEQNNAEYIFWGDADDFPNKLDWYFRRIGIMQTGVEVNANVLYGNGMEWATRLIEDNKRIVKLQVIDEWDAFTEDGIFQNAMAEAAYSLEYLNIAFLEVVLNNERTYPNSQQLLDTPSCRFKKRETDGLIKKIAFSSKFGEGSVIGKNDIEWINIYNPKIDLKKQAPKLVIPIQYRTLGNHFYPEPTINALKVNKWLQNAMNVPNYIEKIYDNQISVKYHVTIPFALLLEFAGTSAEKWSDMELKTRLEWKLKCKEYIDKQLTGTENAGKSIVTFSLADGANTHEIVIEPIESKLDSSKELPNSYASNYEILAALNVDPAITGFGIPGGKNLSGSGSDKREALLIAQALRKRDREVLLKYPRILGKIMGLNKKHPGIFPVIIDTDTSQTLDKNPNGKQNVVQ